MLPAILKMLSTGCRRASVSTVSVVSLLAALATPLAWATDTPSTTVLTISPASPQTGGTVQTLTATVTATTGGASVTPGVVNFYDLTSVAAAGPSGSYTARPLLIGTAQLKSNGTASIKVILGSGATHTLSAKFLRNTTYAASTSSNVADVISGGQHDPITITTTGNANYNNGSSPRNTYNMDVQFTYYGYTAPPGTMSFSNTATSAVLGTTTNLNRGSGSPYQQVSQQAATPSVAAGTSSVAKGDFNGDGKLDIVATDTSAATVSVYLGNGDGTFGSETTYAVGSAASDALAGIAVGDFNNDGKLDIAVPNSTTGNVSILLGNGDGTFATHVEYTTPTHPNRIVVGDFNEDGTLDLMVAGGSGSSYSVSLLLGNGSGGFSASTSLTNTTWTNNSAGVTDMVVADFNGDGHLDLLTDCYSCENFALFKGNGDGTFQAVVSGYPPQPNLPFGLAVGDWNGDGIPDIAFAAPGTSGGQVYVALNDGTGAFGHVSGVAFGGSTKWIGAADMNGDGWPDIVSTNYASGIFSMAAGNPGSASATAFGFLTPITQTSSAHPGAMIAGDFLGNGLNEFVVAAPSNLNLFQFGQGNEAAVGSTYFGQTGIVLTSTTSLSPNNFNATYIPASSDIYGGSVSNIVALPVYGVSTPTLSVGQSSYAYGQSPVLTMTVPSISGTVPTGTIDVYTYSGYSQVGSSTLASGSASYTLSVPNAGSYGLTPLYEGDANYVSSSSTVNTQFTVVPETPTLSVTSSPSTQIVGGNVTLSATVGVTANAHAGIVVNLHLGSSGASCTTNSSGQCSATIVMPSPGAQAVTASVVATQNLTTASATGSTSPTGYQITSTPVLTSSTNPSFPSQSVTFTVTLPVVSGFTPTGSVDFIEGGNTLSTAYLNGSGVATYTTSALALGSHSIVAAYSGDGTFFAANSSALTQVVAAASFSVSLATPATVTQGSATTLSATVTANGNGVNPAWVQFYDASSSPQLLGTVSTNSSGVATLLRVLSPGAHIVQAVFTGQGAGSVIVSSSNRTATVTGNGTLATLTGLSLLGSPGSYTLSAPVSLSGGSAPTGTVNFLDATNGNAVIGTGSVGTFTRSLATPALYAVGANPPGVFSIASATGDLNGDGILDLVVANYTDGGGNGTASITVLLGNGDGTFTANNTFQAFDPSSLTLVDVDQDGILDLLVTRDGNNDMQVYHGVGDGTFTQLGYGINGGLFPIDIGVADFDKDGIPDIVITSNSGGARFVHGNGDGTFGQYGNGTNFSTGNRSIGITVGDYNLDGNPDFIVTNAADGTVGVFLGDGTGNFASQVTYSVGNYPNSIVTGDFNADGKPDIAVTNQSDHTIGILLGNGDGTFQTMVTYNAGTNGPGNISVADMNGDGKDDLIVTNTVTINGQGLGIQDQNNGGNFYDNADSDNTVGIFTSNGDGTFQAMTTVSTGSGTIPYATVVGDFNGDGLPDFAVPNSATDNIGVFLGKRSGTATLTGSAVNNAGPVLVKARYTPGTSDAYATSSSSNVQLQALSVPTLTSSANPSPNGSALTFTANVPTLGGVVPTGVIGFLDNSGYLGATALASGSATYTTSSLSTGTHSITAYYNGNSRYVTSTSAALSQVITIPTTSVTLTTSQTPRVYGASVTFTATLGSSSATGTVTFKDGATILGTGTLTAGVATFATATLTAGSHSMTAVYGGDSNFSGNTSATVTQVVTQSTAATTTLTTSGTPAAFGTSVTFTATLGNLAATGTVQFMDGATVLGTGTVASGVATYSSSALAVATHSMTAVYSGDSNFAASTSSALSQVITISSAATTVVTTSLTPAAYGSSVTFTATLGSSAATGTVQFKDGTNVLGTGTVTAGVASYSTSALTVATHTITAVYSGDSSYATSTSSALSQVITTSSAATTTLTTSQTPVVYGTSVTFTATLGSSSATGTVQFKDGATVLGSGVINSGAATYTTSALTGGTHSITAVYSGDGNYATSTSSALSQVITTSSAATTAVTTSVTPAGYGTSVTFTATLGSSTATGTVQFKDGATVLGTGTVTSGVATYSTSSLTGGTHSITAVYSGDGNYAGTTSSALSQVITTSSAATTALTTSLTPAAYSVSVAFTATLGSSAASGTVQFKDGSTVLGTGTVSSGVATYSTGALSVGTHSITAVYSGDSNYAGSTSSALSQVITISSAATTTLTSSLNPSNPGVSVTFTATLGSSAATGTVQFKDGTTVLGTGTVTAGVATYTTSSLSTATHSITAIYSGDSNYATSTSAALSQVVNVQVGVMLGVSTTLSGFGPSVSVTYGQTVFFNAIVSPYNTGTPAQPSGAVVQFTTVGGTLVSSIGPITGVATGGASTLPVGTNQVVASYTDSLGLPAVTSTPVTVIVTQATGTLAAPTLSPTSAAYGTNVTITQAVPSGMTGSLTFYSGSTALGTGTIASGVATLTTNTLPAGTNAITTAFAGNANITAATSPAASITIAKANVTMGALTVTPSSAVFGTSVTMTQAVPSGVTGTINFYYNSTVLLGSGTISGGVATLASTALPAGTDSLTGFYLGDANNNAGSRAFATAIITAATSTTATLSASTSSASYGTSETLTSTVTVSGNPLTSGTVTFLSGSTSIGTASLNGSGVATLSLTTLPVGSNVLTASIASSANYSAAVSTSVTVTITQATPSILSPTPSPTTAAFGSPVTITQNVPTGVTGTLNFYSGSTLLGTSTISGTSAVLVTSSIPVGTSALTTSFGGNANFTPVTSFSRNITITQATPTLAAPSASPTSATPGTPVTFTQTVPAGATGTISFYSGSTLLGTGTISGTTATLTTTALAPGSNSITATFPGNANFTSATSAPTIVTVGAAPTTTALVATPSGGAYGTSITLTATVTAGGSPVTSGTVQFLLGGVLQGTGTLNSSGVATFTTATFPAGLNLVTATFAATSSYATSTSTAYSVNINKATPSLSAPTMSPSSASYGTPVTITQSFPTGVAGTVSFYNGSTLLGTATIAGGVATLTTSPSALAVGSNTINVLYAGNANYNSVYAPAASVTITQASLTLAGLNANPTTATYGSQIIFNVNISTGTSAIATGTVTFFNGSTSIGTGQVSSTVAALVTSSLPVGVNSITASYAGSTNFAAATSSAISVTITPAALTLSAPTFTPASPTYGTTVTLTQAVPTGVTGNLTFYNGSTLLGTATISGGVATLTTSALAGGANSVTSSFPGNGTYPAATSAAVTINVTPATVQLPALSFTPSTPVFGAPVTLSQTVPTGVTGTINFYSGSVAIGTGTITGGVATLTTSSLPGGVNAITGSFAGNSNYAAAVSAASTVTVSPATPTLSTPSASPTSASLGTPVTLTQAVPSGATGTVTFSSNGVTLGTATISNGTATLTTSALPAGTNSISGSYSGNANYTAATSAAVSVIITVPSANLAAPTASPNSASYGTSVTLTQAVPTGATGVVTFTASGTVLGTAPIVNGVATFTTTSLAGGNNSITGTYAGNSSVSGGTSAPATVTITPAMLSLSPVTSSPAATTYNTPVTLTQLLPSGATGTVTFTSGSLTLGTAPILNGVATLPNISLPVGSNTVTASYAGNNNYTSATSTSSPILVSPATATLAAPLPSPPNAVFGAPVTLTQAVPTGLTGTVTFSSNNVSLGTATIVNGVATLTTSALQGGTNFVIGAAYSGNNNYLPATSATTTIQIAAATPNLPAPVISPATASAGSPVTITQAVPAGATGTVTFTSGSTILGSAPIVNGVATLTTAALPVGANAVTGSYPGNNNYTAGTSPSASITITPASTTLPAPTASPTTSTFGASVTLTQTVPVGVTGTITFAANGIALGTATIVNGAATLTTTALPGGANLLGTSYPGNGSFAAATSTAGFITVSPATLTLPAPSASAITAVPGTPITFTQSFPAGATGTATFSSGSTVLGMVPIVNGVATLTTATLPSGSNAIAVSYPGNNNYTAATSPAVTVAVGLATVSLSAPSASPTGASYGTAVTLSQPVPTGVTGTISFYNGSTLLGTATISNGVATLTTSTLPGGPNTITGSFGGNGSYAAAVSAPAAITINPAAPTLSAPSSSPSNAPYGTAVTLTQAVPAGATGTITFYNGTTALGTATIANGVATLTTSTLPVGTNSITGSFGGNSNYTAATSAVATVTITPTAPTLAAPTFSPTGATYGANVTLTQTVPAGVTGTITFYNGTTALGTATIVNGVATLTTTTLPAGSNSVTASYNGGGNYAPSTSAPALIAIAQSTPILVAPTASPTSATFGASVTLTQAVPAGVTGTIIFYNGTTALGTATIANGVATLTTTTLPVGTNSVTGSFGGSGNYTVATSAPLTVTIAPVVTPGYTITANPPSLTIHAGSTGTSMLTFLPVGGYSGTFTLVCNNLPANASCQFMQNGTASSTIVMSGNNQPVLVDLNVITSTMAHSATPGSVFGGKAPLLLNCGLFALIVLGRRRKSLRGAVTLCGSFLLGALLLGGLTGCAGGFGVATTPLGTSVATVTATASATSVGGGGSAATPTSLNLTITIIQ